MHCKDTILRTQNNWPYSKLIPNSGIHANILQDWLRRTSFLRFILNDKMIWIFYFDTSSYRSIQFQSHQVQLKEPLPEHLKIKKSKSNEQALQRIKCKLNASTNSEITARILQPDISKHKTTGKRKRPQQPAAGNRIKLNSFFPGSKQRMPKILYLCPNYQTVQNMVTFKEFFSFKKNGFFWLNLAGMIILSVAAVFGTLAWLDSYTHHGESHVVPDVKNKTVTAAHAALRSQLLKGTVTDSVYIKGMPNGIVLEQKPASGARVKEGRMVYLTVTTTDVPVVKLPDLIDNSSFRQAEAKLKAMGFRLTEPEFVVGEQDWIYGIKYRGRLLKTNDPIPHEALLTLCVGNTALRDSLSNDSTQIGIESTRLEDQPQVDESWF